MSEVIPNGDAHPRLSIRATEIACVALACALTAMPLLAQDDADQRTGVSHPSTAPITTDVPDTTSAAPASAPVAPPAPAPATTSATVYGPYVPYHPAGAAPDTPPASTSTAQAFDPDASIVTDATAGLAQRRLLSGPSPSELKADEDAGIVTHLPSQPGELAEGTLVQANLREEISTLTTRPGTKFSAVISQPVLSDGRVIIPEGSILEGRVTWVRGGKRIGGSPAIHMEPRTVTLPDGTQYVLRARVIDTNSWANTKVDDEGTIVRSENRKRDAGVMALTAGSGLAAGAMIAGPAGALVGAGVGAGVSTIVWLKQDRQAVLPQDLGLIFSLTEPMNINPASAAVHPEPLEPSGGE